MDQILYNPDRRHLDMAVIDASAGAYWLPIVYGVDDGYPRTYVEAASTTAIRRAFPLTWLLSALNSERQSGHYARHYSRRSTALAWWEDALSCRYVRLIGRHRMGGRKAPPESHPFYGLDVCGPLAFVFGHLGRLITSCRAFRVVIDCLSPGMRDGLKEQWHDPGAWLVCCDWLIEHGRGDSAAPLQRIIQPGYAAAEDAGRRESGRENLSGKS